ncbi:MAG: primosomal protein N' [Bacteroidetes bacterium]|nr:primosomal protein N' [Bacteroidota bacterium]
MNLFADVLLPLPIKGSFTYSITSALQHQVSLGKRVVVPFGKSRLYTGIIRAVHDNAPEKYTAKEILLSLDDHPIVNSFQMEFWEWMASYYMCSPGEVMQAALPSAFLISSETRIVLNAEKQTESSELSDREYLVFEALSNNHVLSYKDVAEILGIKTIHPLLKELFEKGVITFYEELRETYKPKTENYISLSAAYCNAEKLAEAFASVAKAAKQEDVLMQFVSLAGQNKESYSISKKKFLKLDGISNSALQSLLKRGILTEEQRETGRLHAYEEITHQAKGLNDDQSRAFGEISEKFASHDVILLHGVTGSGKTEIYIHLIEEQIKLGKQVLYLLPEIALTTQIIRRLQNVLGDKVGIYHSRYSMNERVEVWNKVQKKDGYKVVLGARSSLFLPFDNLGLIIVDEEHESSFKQQEPAPRYNARDMSVILGWKHKAKVLLGSATPSIESYHNALNEKYGLVKLEKRHGGVMMPEILCADVQEERRKKKMKSIFSSLLIEHMEAALENREQIILFQNRRGFAPMLECKLCGHTPKCNKCDVSLTFHKTLNLLKCHYCGYAERKTTSCVACGSVEVELVGFGTQKIEEEIMLVFPNAKVGRMDWDTTRSKNSYQQIISDFEDKSIDILVGTQMVSKGLDFDNVALVGILNADQMLNFPDFRAHERAYQMMSQVSGRAGRKNKRGKVVIQTYSPEHNIVRYVIDSNYEALYHSEVLLRRNFKYPPFYRLVGITIKHQNLDLVNAAAAYFAGILKDALEEGEVLGPEFPAIARIRGEYIKNILVKIPRNATTNKTKDMILFKTELFNITDPFKKCRLIIDVDPV